MTTRRVLYVELNPKVGGSVISLYQLLRFIPRDRVEPAVLLLAGHPYRAVFAQLGVTVLTTGIDPSARRLPPVPLAVAQRSGLVQRLRGSSPGRNLYHTLGFLVKKLPVIVAQAWELARLFRQVQPDLIHLNDTLPAHNASLLAAIRNRTPAVVHVRAFTPYTLFDRWLAGRPIGYLCISQAIATWLRQQGVRSRPIAVVYNGVALADFVPGEGREAARASLGLHPDDLAVGLIGRLEPWKGQTVFLDALARARQECPTLRGLLIGDAQPAFPHYEAELRQRATELGLGEGVIFAGRRDDLGPVLAALDLVAHTSVAPEPFGRVIIEAMAAARPVIVSDAGAGPEIVTDGETGRITPAGDVGALAAAMVALAQSPVERERLAQAGRALVATRFTAEATAQGVVDFYERLGMGSD